MCFIYLYYIEIILFLRAFFQIHLAKFAFLKFFIEINYIIAMSLVKLDNLKLIKKRVKIT